MEEIILWMSLLAAYMKTDPVYSFVLDSVPLMVVSVFGAMVDTMVDKEEITARKSLGNFLSAIVVAIVVSAAGRETTIKTHYSVAVAILGGFRGRWFLNKCVGKIENVIKKFDR